MKASFGFFTIFKRFLLECFTSSLIHKDQPSPDTGVWCCCSPSCISVNLAEKSSSSSSSQALLTDTHSCLRPKYHRGNQPKQGTTTRAREELSLCSSPSPLARPPPTERPGLFLAESGLGHAGLPPPHSPPGCLTLSCFCSTLLALLWTEP